MKLVDDITQEIIVGGDDNDDVLAVLLRLQANNMHDGLDLVNEGQELAQVIRDYSDGLITVGNELAELVAILVRCIWGNDALRMLVALPLNRGKEKD